MAEIFEVEIFAVGTWNDFKFTIEDLEEISLNTNKFNSRKIPLKLGHSENQILIGQTDGDPALGWAKNIRVKNQKIVADFIDIPEIVYRAIQQGLYRNVSVEMRHVEDQGWRITAVALLGADLPAVKNLNELDAFLNTETAGAVNAASFGGVPSEMLFSIKNPIILGKGNMLNDLEYQELIEKVKSLQQENSLLTAEKIDSAFSKEKEKFLESYKKDVEAGKLSPAVFRKIENVVSSQKKSFSEGAELTIPAQLMSEIFQSYREEFPQFSEKSSHEEQTHDARKPDEILEEKIFECMERTGKSYDGASKLVFKSNPQLLKSYKNMTIEISEGRSV